ncbi:MAG: polyprenyl diphosphate synthase [Candidatus Woesearchaeota archaeon]|jgi:tritrans,polycis-undecaprenyl-diphosphate synthase [geranylgeranyl-diphosphate specific]|nr:di-trans,poly-cis-decaprenylcistransferase [Gammaproteobacteria bacterium]MDP7180356.1 polyprenyl diphosphate synthase [Candidatus Woesearchaeota archaeon]
MKKLKHIAIILDGNRRFSKKLGLKWWQGHEKGAEKVEQLFDWCKELGIKEVTLYSFSIENFERTEEEKGFLMKLFIKMFNKVMKDKRIHENKIKIKFIGRRGLFPLEIQKTMNEVEENTKDYDGFRVNFAMGYGGRAEIVDAVKKIVSKGVKASDIDEELLSKNMYLDSEPELLIRPGGEFRISNFLVWQSSYMELWFTDKLWPEFEKEDLVEAINDFNARERRFGV